MTKYIVHAQTQFTKGFDPKDTAWYFGSLDVRTANLEHMYVTLVYALTHPTPDGVEETKKATNALFSLLSAHNVVQLPNWIVAMLLTCVRENDWVGQALQTHCRLQCLTLLQMIYRECVDEAYLLDTESSLFWMRKTGLPPLPLAFFCELLDVVRKLFPNDRKIRQLHCLIMGAE